MIRTSIINKDICFDGCSYNDLVSLTNRWKHLLKSKGAKKGNKLAISILDVNSNNVALAFAAAELGMLLFYIDLPVHPNTLPKTKMGMFGPVDFTVECDKLKSNFLHNLMVKSYSKYVISENEIKNYMDEDTTIVDATDYLLASTSGTTNQSRPVIFTQKEVYEISKRNIKVFELNKHNRIAHTKNMHHASSMLTSMLPSLMICDNHYNIQLNTLKEDPEKFVSNIVNNNIDRMLIVNRYYLNLLLNYSGKFKNTLLLNVSGYTVPAEFTQSCKKHNIEYISHFGSIDTGIPLLVNRVNEDSVYVQDWLGYEIDDFYKMKKVGDIVEVYSKLWEGKRILADKLEQQGDLWLHKGRDENNKIFNYAKSVVSCDFSIVDDWLVVWGEMKEEYNKMLSPLFKVIKLEKQDFTTETKVNIDQLKEFLKNV